MSFLRKIIQLLDGTGPDDNVHSYSPVELRTTYESRTVKYQYGESDNESDGSNDTDSDMPELVSDFVDDSVQNSTVLPVQVSDDATVTVPRIVIINNEAYPVLVAQSNAQSNAQPNIVNNHVYDDAYAQPDISISGARFNDIYSGVRLVKLTNEDCVHNGFEFVEGINVDFNNFDSTQVCGPDGLYFCKHDDMTAWLEYNEMPMTYIWDVTIPNDARCVVYGQKLKTDKLILSNRRNLSDELYEIIFNAIGNGMSISDATKHASSYPSTVWSDRLFSRLVEMDESVIKYVPNMYRSYDMCLTAAKHYHDAYTYIPDMYKSYEILTHCIKLNPKMIKMIEEKNMSEELYNIAFSQDASLYRYIPERFKTSEMIPAYIKTCMSYASFLPHIPMHHRTEAVYDMMVKTFSDAVCVVPFRYKTPEMIQNVLESPGSNALLSIPLKYVTKQTCIDSVLKNYAVFTNGTVPSAYQDLDFFKALVNKYPTIIKQFVNVNQINSVENAITLIKINPECYSYIFQEPSFSKLRELDTLIDLIKCGVHLRFLPTHAITFEFLTDLVTTRPSIIREIENRYLSDDLYMIAMNREAITFDQIPEEYHTSELCKLHIKLTSNIV